MTINLWKYLCPSSVVVSGPLLVEKWVIVSDMLPGNNH
jgi:hypothetical protein